MMLKIHCATTNAIANASLAADLKPEDVVLGLNTENYNPKDPEYLLAPMLIKGEQVAVFVLNIYTGYIFDVRVYYETLRRVCPKWMIDPDCNWFTVHRGAHIPDLIYRLARSLVTGEVLDLTDL